MNNSVIKKAPFFSFKRLSVIIRTLRVKQWTKNLLLFAGVVFARQLLIISQMERVVTAFMVFCLLSSALYIFNDIMDLESDRNHPRKKFRPIASGAVSIPAAICLLSLLGALSLITAYILGVLFFEATLVYAAQTILYSLYLKRLVIIDVMAIATGFVLRAVAGALVIDVPISPWLLVCTLLLALFLALIKRRQEVLSNGTGGSRHVLSSYPIAFLDQAISIITAATLTGYFLYTFTAHTERLMLTIPFVIYGIFRYLLLTYRQGAGEEPEHVLVSDIPFLINLFLWLVCSGVIMYWR